MSEITLILPDKKPLSCPIGCEASDAVGMIGQGLKNAALAVKVDGELKDLSYRLSGNCNFSVITEKDPEALDLIRHSAAHLMAMAVKELWPDCLLAIGPTIEDGFYYDIDSEHTFSPDDFPEIENKMKEISRKSLPLERCEVKRESAIKEWEQKGELYKVELLNDLDTDMVSYYSQGSFFDLCRGPHVPHTGKIRFFKILSCAGAYWRGDVKNKMLQRLYGTAFSRKEDLTDYLYQIEEAKKRDHRKLGKELDLFSFHQEGAGFPFWHPKGMRIYNTIMDFCRLEHLAAGYGEVMTPVILNEQLWRKSGHWDKYRENMYFTEIDETSHAIKPMNCPGGLLIIKNSLHSYKEFPIKNFEFGLVHRHEKAGVLHGLFRVRQFTQDDAHIFCLPHQIEEQIGEVFDFILKIYQIFGFSDYKIELSTRPADYIGSLEVWNTAETALKNVLDAKEINYQLNPGDGAFYGPKIDFHILDSLKRSWQCGTIQLDFSMPNRFEVEYTDAEGEKKTPVMIHRALLGSMERFIGILLENYAGDLPFWLAPVHFRILPISEKYISYAQKVGQALTNAGFYCETDGRSEKIGKKIRESENNKIPFMIILGEKEQESGTISLRQRKIGDIGVFSIDEIIEKFKLELKKKD